MLSGKGILARPMETNFRRPSSVESVREECATVKKHETFFRRPSSVESVRDECASMKKRTCYSAVIQKLCLIPFHGKTI